MRKVFLGELPKLGKGNKINWKSSIGESISFIYDDTDGILDITNYNVKNHRVFVKYNNIEYNLYTDDLLNNKLGSIVNNISNKAKWMIKYLANKEDSIKFTVGSEKSIKFICPDCGASLIKVIKNVYNNKKVNCICGDSISYPEKFIANLLSQVHTNFKFQLTNKNFNWCNNYKYDFYINDFNCIIETHGLQHYEESFNRIVSTKKIRNLKEEQENDRRKEQLAKDNGIEHYIVLDCRKSELEWIKKSVLDSELLTLFNYNESDIDWLKCEEYALSNLVKQACEYKSNDPNLTTSEIGQLLNISGKTIKEYLKLGSKYNWCVYDPKKEHQRVASLTNNKHTKSVEIFKNDMSLGVFISASELSRISENLFGVKLSQSRISNFCLARSKLNNYKGFTFKFV